MTLTALPHRMVLDASRNTEVSRPALWGVLGYRTSGELSSFPGALTFRREQVIFVEGDETASMFQLLDGMVSLYRLLPDGRRQVIEFALPGDLLGFTPTGRHIHSAMAVSQCQIAAFSRAALDTAITRDPQLAKGMLENAYALLSKAHGQLMTLGRKSALERVASFLLDLSLRLGDAEVPAREVALPMTRSDIADHLGLTIETVSRSFSKLKKEGVISLTGQHVAEIRDLPRLAELAGGDIDIPRVLAA
ncbi:MAG: helix-turn-helix domain-containing protein [Geminicoccaceae bacterium]